MAWIKLKIVIRCVPTDFTELPLLLGRKQNRFVSFSEEQKMQLPVYSYFCIAHDKPWLITMLCFCLCSLQQFILFPYVFSVLRMAYVIPPSAPSPAVTMRVFLSLHVVSPAYTLWGNNITSQSDLTNGIELCLVKNFHWINQVTATLLSILPFEQQVLFDCFFFFQPASFLQCCDKCEATISGTVFNAYRNHLHMSMTLLLFIHIAVVRRHFRL